MTRLPCLIRAEAGAAQHSPLRNNERAFSFGGMPRYFRHIQQGEQRIDDPEGVELPDLDAARSEALEAIRGLLAEAIRTGKDDWIEEAIVIADSEGRELMRILFIEGLPPVLHKAMLGISPLASRSLGKPGEEGKDVSTLDRET